MVTKEEALPGRAEEMPITNKHFVLGNPIRGQVPDGHEVAVFATGCFWGTEKGFWRLPGVYSTAVGYVGGYTPNPTYREVCSGRTGHTEAVYVVYDPKKVSYVDLLRLYWQSHDPTQGMGQGNDRGTQYRSGVYTDSAEKTTLAHASKEAYGAALRAEDKGSGPSITSEIVQGSTFYYAEDDHQQYLGKPGARQYCSAMPTGVQVPDFTKWAPADLAEKHKPFLPDAFWLKHGPTPACTIGVPNAPIQWP